MDTRITGLVFTKQEESNIEACLKSMDGVDEKVVFDDSSTDKTREIAEKCGAKVITRDDQYDIPTQEDVDAFTKRFGWKPIFVTKPEEDKTMKNKYTPAYKIPPKDGCLNTNRYLSMLETDWVIGLSADEHITWDLSRIRKEIMPIADQIECDFIHSHKPDGSPETVMKRVYMYKKSMTKFVGRTHGTTLPAGTIVHCPFFKIDHWQKPNAVVNGKAIHSQSYVLPIMEYSVLKEDDPRSRFYLGREYYYYHRYDEAIKLLKLYLEIAGWAPEIQMAYIYLARCYWESQQGDKAREAGLEAIRRNPDSKEALNMMSEYYFEPEKSKWKAIADRSTNKDVLW
jgi:tetratricopeptide (TPR) repeat protein